MSLIRPFSALDLFEFNAINLDVWTETYGVNYYLSYLMHWGDLFSCVLSPSSSSSSCFAPRTRWLTRSLPPAASSSRQVAMGARSTWARRVHRA